MIVNRVDEDAMRTVLGLEANDDMLSRYGREVCHLSDRLMHNISRFEATHGNEIEKPQ